MVALRAPFTGLLWHVLVLVALCALGRVPEGAAGAEEPGVAAAASGPRESVAIAPAVAAQGRAARSLRTPGERPGSDGRSALTLPSEAAAVPPARVVRVAVEDRSASCVAFGKVRALPARGPPS